MMPAAAALRFDGNICKFKTKPSATKSTDHKLQAQVSFGEVLQPMEPIRLFLTLLAAEYDK